MVIPGTWKQIPAVTTGGKPYFYQRYGPDGSWQATVVWNRSVRAYAVEALKRLDNGIRTGRLVKYVGTVQAGKRLAEREVQS